MKPFLSLCMIVKNEESVLRRCLDSVRGIVDEIIIVDTGSTDRSREIASEYTNWLFDYEWNNDFAGARNYAASKASGEWILVLDADEYVDRYNLKQAIEEIKRHDNQFDIYAVNIVNFTGQNGEITVQHQHSRIYKNDGTIQFYRSIHEQLRKKDRQANIGLSSLIIYHSGYLVHTVKTKSKYERNLPLVQKELNRLTNIGFDYFNLGNELKRLGKTIEALDAYIKAYQNRQEAVYGWVPFCLCNMVDCLMELHRYRDALDIIYDAEYIYANVADFVFLKGEIYLQQHRYDDAKSVFIEIVSNKQNYNQVVRSVDCREYFPHRRLGRIYELEGNYEQSVVHYIKALNFNRFCLESFIRLVQLLDKFHSEKEIYDFLSKQLLIDNKSFLQKVLIFFVNQGWFELSRSLARDYFQEQQIVYRLIDLKQDIMNGNMRKYENVTGIDSSLFLHGIHLGIVDLADLLIMYKHLNDSFVKRCIQVIIASTNIMPIVECLETGDSSLQIEEGVYLYVLEKSLKLQKQSLVRELLDIRHAVDKGLEIKIARIFYEAGHTEEAMSFYRQVNSDCWSAQDYVHIIERLLSQSKYQEAYIMSQEALKRFQDDFRFYKYVILLGDSTSSYLQEVKLNAFQRFPQSEWLRKHI
ncbi:glycosyltransferase family 2 protein [Geobacillus kaustophilus]|uniref:glycosyltransferase n=1 Tax=Geobacillus kaustophilus TaxID=1462 RepID=UPI0006976FF9|nr:glycosyltransferase family 2 protein [Geobacillus kaustophilus]